MIKFNIFPGGKTKAFTLSYDDGREEDKKLIEIINKYGIKGSFHLNSAKLIHPASLYDGHEISMHTVNHVNLTQVSPVEVCRQITEDKKALEEYAGYIIRSMSYPYGTYNKETLKILDFLGVEYSRTVKSTGLGLTSYPENFLEWHPNFHHNNEDILVVLNAFGASNKCGVIFYVWGHSYEFTTNNNWDRLEDICKTAKKYEENIWFATGIDICDYAACCKMVKISADQKTLFNPTYRDIWAEDSEEGVIVIPAGQTITLK